MTSKDFLIKKIKQSQLPALKSEDIENLRKKLAINFSKDFFELSILGDFEYNNSFSFYNLHLDNACSVVGETLRLRKDANLPLDTLILSEDDASIWLMKCLGDHEEIYWIAVEDYENYCEGKPLEYDPNVFPTFTDFFAYLLDEEEKLRAEESK